MHTGSGTGMEILPDTVPANTHKNVTCVSIVASVGLQDLANPFSIQRALTMEFLVQEILRLNIASQDSDSDDDVSALIGSDSDILETVEKADFVEFLDDNSSTLAGSEADLDTQVTFKQHQFITSGEKLQKGTSVFLLCQIK